MLFRLARIAPLALTLTLLCTAPALAATNVYYVQGTGDGSACVPIEGFATYFRCDGLRVAVNAASANPDSADEAGDVVYLQAAGEYTVNTPLALTDRVTIFGRRGRAPRRSVAAARRACSRSRPGPKPTSAGSRSLRRRDPRRVGGNILNEGTLNLLNMRVTEGFASAGGGIASTGSMLIDNSRARRQQRGVHEQRRRARRRHLRHPGAGPGSLSISDSTIADNQRQRGDRRPNGGGLASTGDATLVSTTIARNAVAGGSRRRRRVLQEPRTTAVDASARSIAANMRGTAVRQLRRPRRQ